MLSHLKLKTLLFILPLLSLHLWGYVPKSLEGKYRFSPIDRDFCYSYWLNTYLKKYYGSEQLLRESFAPTAMVDKAGRLFTMTLYGFNSNGPHFKISRYTPQSDGSILSLDKIDFYPWTYVRSSPNVSTTPFVGVHDDEYLFFQDCIYNVFSPCIAQEPGDIETSYICTFFYIPPPRFYISDVSWEQRKNLTDKEGIMYFDFNKETLKVDDSERNRREVDEIYRFDRQRPRRDKSSYKLYPQVSSYSAWHISEDVHLIWIGLTEYYAAQMYNFGAEFYTQYNKWQRRQGSPSTISGMIPRLPGGMILNDRYILVDGWVYGMLAFGGYTPVLTMQSRTGSSVYRKAMNWNFLYVETYKKGDSDHTAYKYDFCILKAKDGTKIWCVLGFNAGGNYSSLDGNSGWSSTYCNWDVTNLALTFRSFVLSSGTSFQNIESQGYRDYIQNIIYVTDIQRASREAVSSEDTSKGDLYRLYLNTHKMCVWTSPKTGRQYIIYAYCYPGRKKQLYLGYAPIEIDSDYRVNLFTKTEFRDSSGNSFGDFKDCSRIISMDCRNDHLWITFMSGNSYYYKYFHIKASDLIQE